MGGFLSDLVELCLVRDRIVYIKRDDLLHLPESGVSGSKARKMLALKQLPPRQFSDAVVSYSGAQSNAMLAIVRTVLLVLTHHNNHQNRNPNKR